MAFLVRLLEVGDGQFGVVLEGVVPDVLIAVKVAWIPPAPLPLARPFAGHLTVRPRTEPLVVCIARLRAKPALAVTTPSPSCRAHRLLPIFRQE